jgi:decaprenylphospho-beta-D-ribofuranose 2-oxidase
LILSGWGNFPRLDVHLLRPRNLDDLRLALSRGPLIARGNGRAYGDSAINPAQTIDMRSFNRMCAFDSTSGQLIAEAGVLLADIISIFLPRGWFPAVTPGTKFVTLGGMIAADVHGKNHHCDGSIRNFVDWIEILDGNGNIRQCSREEDSTLFEYTIGGMGLTGVILRAAIRLRPVESGWIVQNLRPAATLSEAIRLFDENPTAAYSVAWIDCLARGQKMGRSLVMFGEHATRADLPAERRDKPFSIPARRAKRFPFDAPSFVLNPWSLALFNEAYYRNGRRRAGRSLLDWDAYFYPLDSIHDWNRLYGRKGFAQFQCVLPLVSSDLGMRVLLDTISKSGQGSFLAVLKRFGAEGGGLSFPMEGYSLALDFPIHRNTIDLLKRLDSIVLDFGGRFYLAKDARMSADVFSRSEQRRAAFLDTRMKEGWRAHFTSAQSERLGI